MHGINIAASLLYIDISVQCVNCTLYYSKCNHMQWCILERIHSNTVEPLRYPMSQVLNGCIYSHKELKGLKMATGGLDPNF